MSDITDKIAKLLEQATRPTTGVAEAATYQAKAESLMAQYNIDQAVIDAKRAQQGKTRESVIERGIYVKGSLAAAYQHVIIATAQGMGLRTWLQLDGGKNRSGRVMFAGFEGDVEQVELMATSLLLQAASALSAWQREHRDMLACLPSSGWLQKKSFVHSFGDGVLSRLSRARRAAAAAAEATSPGTGLVLVDRGARIEQYMADTHGKMGKARGQRIGFNQSGYSAGLNSNTGGTSVGSSPSALGR